MVVSLGIEIQLCSTVTAEKFYMQVLFKDVGAAHCQNALKFVDPFGIEGICAAVLALN